MLMTENQSKALTVLIQSIITALLLFVQSFFFGCVTAQGDVNKTTNTDINFSVPVSIDDYSYLRDVFPENYNSALEFFDINPSNIVVFEILDDLYKKGIRDEVILNRYLSQNPIPVLTSEVSSYGN